MIDDEATYATEYGESSPRTACLGIYGWDIYTTKDASLEIHKKEDVHKATIDDWEIYNVVKNEANRFIVRVVTDV